MRDDELVALIRRRLAPKHARPLPHEPYRTPRGRVALGNDHQSASRDEKIRDLTRMELFSMGAGDLPIGLLTLHPARIIEAVDASAHLPASGIFVQRPQTRAELLEARALREARDMPIDHQLVIAAARDAIHGTDTFHRLTENRDAGRHEAGAADPFTSAELEDGADGGRDP